VAEKLLDGGNPMTAALMSKWYGIHKLQEKMGELQTVLARLSADPFDLKPNRNLVSRLELKMADVMAALQWFEYQNKLNVDPDRMEHCCESFDAAHLKSVPHVPGQTFMPGIVTAPLVTTLTNDDEPPTLQSLDDLQSDACPESAEIFNGCGQS
jgi:hypothetical protein